MPRFFIEECLDHNTDKIVLEKDDAHHISHVLRMKIGDEVIVCDGAKTEFIAIVEHFESGRVFLAVKQKRINNTEPPWRGWLFQGLPKGDKFELIIQKAVELGCYAVVPVACSRSIAKLSPVKAERKLERWNKIAQEAARQCGRGIVPKVYEPIEFSEAVGRISEMSLGFLPWENENSCSLRNLLESESSKITQDGLEIGFLIGPEGGFSQHEVSLAESAGIRSVTLGPRILRTETAGLAVLSMLGYQYEQ